MLLRFYSARRKVLRGKCTQENNQVQVQSLLSTLFQLLRICPDNDCIVRNLYSNHNFAGRLKWLFQYFLMQQDNFLIQRKVCQDIGKNLNLKNRFQEALKMFFQIL